MAGMIAGGIDKEVIQINEDTIWDGSPYGTIQDENKNTITDMDAAKKAQTISTTNQTSGSVVDGWKYYRGANADGSPALPMLWLVMRLSVQNIQSFQKCRFRIRRFR